MRRGLKITRSLGSLRAAAIVIVCMLARNGAFAGTWGIDDSTSITLIGSATGGSLIFADTRSRGGASVTIETEAGEPADSVARRLVSAVTGSDPFQFSPPGLRLAPGVKPRRLEVRDSTILKAPGFGRRLVFGGTERGLGIPESPRYASASYSTQTETLRVDWKNPPEAYDEIFVVVRGTGRAVLPANRTSVEFPYKADMSFDPNNLDIAVVGKRKGIPSGAASVHLAGKVQDELANMPFIDGVAPSWRRWPSESSPVRCEPVKREFDPSNLPVPRYIQFPIQKPVMQGLFPDGSVASGGIVRKFLGLSAGHTYRVLARMNSFQPHPDDGEWVYSFHAAADAPGEAELTDNQLAGKAPLPNGESGPTAGMIGWLDQDRSASGNWVWLTTGTGNNAMLRPITLPPGSTSLTVWLRCSGEKVNGVGKDYVQIEDLTP